MKPIHCLMFFLLSVFSIKLFAGNPELIYTISPGWMLERASVSEKNMKILDFKTDETMTMGDMSRFHWLMVILDADNQKIGEMDITNISDANFMPDGKILLKKRDSEAADIIEKVAVLNSNGRELWRSSTNGCDARSSLNGKEVHLAVHFRIGFTGYLGNEVTILDAETGKKKFRLSIDEAAGGKIQMSDFISVGEDGKYVVALGRTITMGSYLRGPKPLWEIQDIGGDVMEFKPIRGAQDILGVEYWRNHNKKPIAVGLAIVRLNDGRVIFKHEWRRDIEMNIPEIPELSSFYSIIKMENGDLLVYDAMARDADQLLIKNINISEQAGANPQMLQSSGLVKVHRNEINFQQIQSGASLKSENLSYESAFCESPYDFIFNKDERTVFMAPIEFKE